MINSGHNSLTTPLQRRPLVGIHGLMPATNDPSLPDGVGVGAVH